MFFWEKFRDPLSSKRIISDPQVYSICHVFPRIADFSRGKRGKLAALLTQPGPGQGFWKVQDPWSAQKGVTLTPLTPGGY